ncbi:NAD(P)H-quinone oxidoreductase [Mycobacterium sp. 1274756.6]|uniref:NAD(P)H-quinone oxidoreductase n=1 Tax=Mycobacterium sp. 1274756.6 TaxID=1834076 RepID=UPI0008007F85|nr:NAD(P)H-quinone oxidoreductase [Mycobacterium sp. 1274756.6]OBJ70739.1 NAD(P)H-quinone oxidoreductase [Mycobacterium sp. 1274756.6]
MRAIVVESSDQLAWRAVSAPRPGPGEVVLRVRAAGVNRADLLQAAGHYPPPPGASDILGLEVSGEIAELGDGVDGWQVGQPVCALLTGGGYAESVAVPAAQLLPIPDGIDPVDAAGLPEVACTVWSNLVMAAGLDRDQVLLVHGGASGVGSHAVQVAHALGARVAVTAGSAQKLAFCRDLGADITVNYREDDFVAVLREAAGGADVILDIIGAAYLDRNLDALAADGRLVVIGMQGGVKGELNLGKLIGKRARVIGTALRGRPVTGPSGKAAIIDAVRASVWPMLADGRVRPIIGARLPVEQAGEAHRLLADGEVTGKVVLTID